LPASANSRANSASSIMSSPALRLRRSNRPRTRRDAGRPRGAGVPRATATSPSPAGAGLRSRYRARSSRRSTGARQRREVSRADHAGSIRAHPRRLTAPQPPRVSRWSRAVRRRVRGAHALCHASEPLCEASSNTNSRARGTARRPVARRREASRESARRGGTRPERLPPRQPGSRRSAPQCGRPVRTERRPMPPTARSRQSHMF
jgi:hypothetical protein